MDSVFDDEEGKASEPSALVTMLVTIARTQIRKTCGAKGIRTPDLLHAMQTRYQLRHSPATYEMPGHAAPREVERS